MAIPEYRNWLATKCLVNETRQHHSIASCLTRACSVEQAGDDYLQVLGIMVSKREELIDRFGAGITPTTFGGGTINCVIIFGEGMFGTFSVDLGSRRQQAWLTIACGQVQDIVAAQNIDFNRIDRHFNDFLHPDDSRQMIDQVRFLYERLE